jgi:hypothetical protein
VKQQVRHLYALSVRSVQAPARRSAHDAFDSAQEIHDRRMMGLRKWTLAT